MLVHVLPILSHILFQVAQISSQGESEIRECDMGNQNCIRQERIRAQNLRGSLLAVPFTKITTVTHICGRPGVLGRISHC